MLSEQYLVIPVERYDFSPRFDPTSARTQQKLNTIIQKSGKIIEIIILI